MSGGQGRLSATVIGSPNPPRLAEFYAEILGWDIVYSEPTWVMLKPPGVQAGEWAQGGALSIQLEPEFEPPEWPGRLGAQQMMMHLDIDVDDLDAGIELVESLGGRLSDHQPQADVRVMLDPDGHPFCLFAVSPESLPVLVTRPRTRHAEPPKTL